VDRGSGLIRAYRLTGAKTAESLVADQRVQGDEKAVYADKAYEKQARRAALKTRGIKDRIQHRRNNQQKILPRWQTVRNKLIARIRQAVERTFSQLKGRYRFTRMRYRGIEANTFHLDLIAIAYNLRTAALKHA
jgi:IS5 family transposase